MLKRKRYTTINFIEWFGKWSVFPVGKIKEENILFTCKFIIFWFILVFVFPSRLDCLSTTIYSVQLKSNNTYNSFKLWTQGTFARMTCRVRSVVKFCRHINPFVILSTAILQNAPTRDYLITYVRLFFSFLTQIKLSQKANFQRHASERKLVVLAPKSYSKMI